MAENLTDKAAALAAAQSQFNKEIRTWATMTQGALIRNVHSMNIIQRKELLNRLIKEKAKLSKGDGEVFRVQFPNTLGGIMTSKGIGRGGSTNRTAKDWYGTTMEIMTEILADKVMEYKADATAINVDIKTKI